MEQGKQCFTLKWRGESNPWGHFYLKISQQGVFSSQHAAVLQDMAESSFKGRRCFLAVAVVCSCMYVTEITFKSLRAAAVSPLITPLLQKIELDSYLVKINNMLFTSLKLF